MANTYLQIGSTVTVGSGGAATMSFTSIPATYTDLVLKLAVRSSRSNTEDNPILTINGTTTPYVQKRLYGDGSTANSANYSGFANLVLGNCPGDTSTANTFGNIEIYIPNYASANFKSLSIDTIAENNSGVAYAEFGAGLWSNTAAITSLSVAVSGFVFKQNSTGTLYGISKS